MFFLVLRDSSSLFIEPKPYDFCIHCLFLLIDNKVFFSFCSWKFAQNKFYFLSILFLVELILFSVDVMLCII